MSINCLTVFDHFVGLARKGLNSNDPSMRQSLKKEKNIFTNTMTRTNFPGQILNKFLENLVTN